MSHTTPRKLFIAVLSLMIGASGAFAQVVGIAADAEELAAPFSPKDETAFKQPGKVFYPETWFHFIGGNVSKEGIYADLQAIADAGISGIQWFHGYFGGPWPGTGGRIPWAESRQPGAPAYGPDMPRMVDGGRTVDQAGELDEMAGVVQDRYSRRRKSHYPSKRTAV